MKHASLMLTFLAMTQSAMAAPASPDLGVWHCNPTIGQDCDQSGCRAFTPSVRLVLAEPDRLWRCAIGKADDCDIVDADYSRGGAFLNVTLAGRSGFVKVADDLTYMEVVSLMQSVYINRGTCAVGPPPIEVKLPG